ncbi:MAG: Bax inhibitor-1/YccA family protein [Candidatus Magnetoovum sp. WYHC-5]|nr:Bax inhibitor-1/YccA family protein [Candidatus Magnetoovum sp. WYHC-5]
MKTANPALGTETFYKVRNYANASDLMTVQGTANKTLILILLSIVSSIWVWKMFYSGGQANIFPYMIGGAIGGFIVSIITIFKNEWSAFTAPLYALLEGLFLGGISAMFEARYPGIAFQAVSLSFGTLLCLLVAFKSGLIRVSERFKMGVIAATSALFLVYFVSFLLGLFGIQIPGIFGSGTIGIIFSLIVVVVAALNLVLDFDFIVKGAAGGAPKYMEWYGAFGLMVTLVWLYIEILRLLAKLNSDND